MKYFIKTNYVEDFEYRKYFGLKLQKTKCKLDLISIGIVSTEKICNVGYSCDVKDIPSKVCPNCDKGQYFAISKDFNLIKAWKDKFTRETILLPIHIYLSKGSGFLKDSSGDIDYLMVNLNKSGNYKGKIFYKHLKTLISKYGKTNEQITKEIIDFVNPNINSIFLKATKADAWCNNFYPDEFEYIKKHNTYIHPNIIQNSYQTNENYVYNQPDFYSYGSDFDWKVFCNLFGGVNNLPKGFPNHFKNLVQILGDKLNSFSIDDRTFGFNHGDSDRNALLNYITNSYGYPKPLLVQTALDTANWIYSLYNFLYTK